MDQALAVEDLEQCLELQVAARRHAVLAAGLAVVVPAPAVVACRGEALADRLLDAHAGLRVAPVAALPQLHCFGFSPSANLIPGGAPAKRRPSGVGPQRSLITWF